MFRCQNCNTVVGPRTKQVKRVTSRYGPNDKVKRHITIRDRRTGREEEIEIVIPLNGQIRSEIYVCGECEESIENIPCPKLPKQDKYSEDNDWKRAYKFLKGADRL